MIFIQLACTWIHPNDVRLPSLEDLHPNPENLIMVTVPMKWNLSPTPPDKKTAKHFRKVHCFAHLSRFARNAVNRKKKHHQRSTTLWSIGASAWHQCVRRQSWSSTQTKKKVLLTWLRWISRVTDGNVNARVVNLSYRKLSIDEVGMKIKTVWLDLKCEMGEKFTVNGID